jgi:ribosomal-protein-alanine N-acetyltransferase
MVDLDRRSLGGLWSAQSYLRELSSPNSCLRILVKAFESKTDRDGEPSQMSISSMAVVGVGCYWQIVDEAHITLLAIDPRYHRRGLGGWLLINLLEDTCQRHLQRATLEVRASNSRALALYQSFGFEPLGTRRRYYPDGEDALILWQNSIKTTDFRQELALRLESTLDRLKSQGWNPVTPKPSPNHPMQN